MIQSWMVRGIPLQKKQETSTYLLSYCQLRRLSPIWWPTWHTNIGRTNPILTDSVAESQMKFERIELGNIISSISCEFLVENPHFNTINLVKTYESANQFTYFIQRIINSTVASLTAIQVPKFHSINPSLGNSYHRKLIIKQFLLHRLGLNPLETTLISSKVTSFINFIWSQRPNGQIDPCSRPSGSCQLA